MSSWSHIIGEAIDTFAIVYLLCKVHILENKIKGGK